MSINMPTRRGWIDHRGYVPPITEMTLFYSGAANPFSRAMRVDLRTGGYSFVDAAGKPVVAKSGFDVNVLSRWLSTGGWNAADPVDRTLIDSMMTCITETSLAQSSQKKWTTLPIEGTLFRVEATTTQNLAASSENMDTHSVSYGFPPPWVQRVQPAGMIVRTWGVLWAVGVVLLVRRRCWRVTKWPPSSDTLPASG